MFMILLILLLLLSLAYLGATLFLANGLLSLPKSGEPHNLSFSVIIAAHNEEAQIEPCLRSVFCQTLEASRYEVIVIDDRSTDATPAILQRLSAERRRLQIITIRETPAGWSPKKWAVAQGVARAKNAVMVFTDADCRVPATWLATIDRNFCGATRMVQGVTTLKRPHGMRPLFFGLQAIDFLSHGVVSAAAIGAGLPLNSNANNLAFLRKTFEDLGGYGDAQRVISGDDDLLLQRFAASNRWAIRFMTDPAGAVTTAPTPSIRGVLEQRKRWASKTIHYNPRQVALLSAIFAFYAGIALSVGLGFFLPLFLVVAAIMMAVKLCGELMLMTIGMRLFGQQSLRKYLPLASLLQLPLVLFAVIGGVLGKFEWKGQTFRRMAERTISRETT